MSQQRSSLIAIFNISIIFLIIQFASGEINHHAESQVTQESPDNNNNNNNNIIDKTIKKDCDKSYTVTCLKLDIVTFVDKLSSEKSFKIIPGISVVKENSSSVPTTSDIVNNLSRSFPNDADKRLDGYVLHKIGDYLSSHSISIKLFDQKTFEAARSLNEEFGIFGNSNTETGRKKDKNGYGSTLMAGLMMMKGTLGAISFGALAMLAGKALMTGLMALMLSAIVGLKSLTSSSEKKTTYEIISKPHVVAAPAHYNTEEIHPGHASGYGRSLDLDTENVHEGIRKYGNVRDRRSII